jgi:hypothetical protein
MASRNTNSARYGAGDDSELDIILESRSYSSLNCFNVNDYVPRFPGSLTLSIRLFIFCITKSRPHPTILTKATLESVHDDCSYEQVLQRKTYQAATFVRIFYFGIWWWYRWTWLCD